MTSSHIAQQFTEDCCKICGKAIQCFIDTVEKLKQGTLMVKELDVLNSHKLETMSLFSSNLIGKIMKDSSLNIEDLIHKRNSDIQKFQSHCSAIRTFLGYCTSISAGNKDDKFNCVHHQCVST